MEERILEFAALLRQHGLRVSTAETLDALGALVCTGIEERALVRDVLRTTCVKRSGDIPVFDELFDLYFSALGDALRESVSQGEAASPLSPEDLAELLQRIAELLEGREVSEIARALLLADEGTLERRMREAMQRTGEQAEAQGRGFAEGRFAHGLGEQLDLAGLRAELEQLGQAFSDEGLPIEDLEAFRELSERRLAELADAVKRAARLEGGRQKPKPRDEAQLGELGEKSFYYLSEDETRRMNEAVKRLAQRLHNVVSVRRVRARRGRLDLHRTLRHNAQFGGVPFDVRFERRRRHRPRIVILCDVSDSVRNVSRFMLQFVYSLQDLYSRVRSFIFVAEVGEVTRLFEGHDAGKALDAALQGNVINIFAHSDFGRAFKDFHRDHFGAIDRRTTVIVLGDARNNYNLPHEWVLKDLQLRARQVIWLNPESRATWGFGDSEMDRYSPFCSLVAECRNLNQLYRVVDRLVTRDLRESH